MKMETQFKSVRCSKSGSKWKTYSNINIPQKQEKSPKNITLHSKEKKQFPSWLRGKEK